MRNQNLTMTALGDDDDWVAINSTTNREGAMGCEETRPPCLLDLVGCSGQLVRVASLLDTISLAALLQTNSGLLVQGEKLWRIHLESLADAQSRLEESAESFSLIRTARLVKEYLCWRVFPIPGFSVFLDDGKLDTWTCVIPGPQDTCLALYEFTLTMRFPDSYPDEPPLCCFEPNIFHVNTFPSAASTPGQIYDDMVLKDHMWTRHISTRDMLLHFELFLLYGNLYAPSQAGAYKVLMDGHREPDGPAGPLYLAQSSRSQYMHKMCQAGRPVARSPDKAFGHKALPHAVVCTNAQDFSAALVEHAGRLDRAVVAAYAGFWDPRGTLVRGGFRCDIPTETILIGSRTSDLALSQTYHVKHLLEAANPKIGYEIFKKEAHGDKVLNVSLSTLGKANPGLFTKDLEVDLISKHTRFAVHSLKDMPTALPTGLMLGCITEREAPEDALILHPKYRGQAAGAETGLEVLPDGAVIGTSSLRREALLRRYFPHLKFKLIRGNIHTRLRKLEEADDYDAIVLAAVGLRRVGLGNKITKILQVDKFPYAVSQGALGVECRTDDQQVRELLKSVEHAPSAARCRAERSVLRALEGGCQIAMGVQTTLTGDDLTLRVVILSNDGKEMIEESHTGPIVDAEGIGKQLAVKLIAKGAKKLLGEEHEGEKRPLTYGSQENPQQTQ
jgi:hydroxymethylbilane synthase